MPIWKNGALSTTSGGRPKAGASCSATSSGWSVTTVLKICTCSSSSSNLSPAAARTTSIFSSIASAAVGGHRLGVDLAPDDLRVDADDVGLLGGEREDLRPAAADHDRDRRVRLGHGVDLGDLVVLALERERAVAPQPLHDPDRLAQALDPGERVVLVDAGDGVVLLRPAGAHAEREPALAEQVDRGALLGEHAPGCGSRRRRRAGRPGSSSSHRPRPSAPAPRRAGSRSGRPSGSWRSRGPPPGGRCRSTPWPSRP